MSPIGWTPIPIRTELRRFYVLAFEITLGARALGLFLAAGPDEWQYRR